MPSRVAQGADGIPDSACFVCWAGFFAGAEAVGCALGLAASLLLWDCAWAGAVAVGATTIPTARVRVQADRVTSESRCGRGVAGCFIRNRSFKSSFTCDKR